MVLLEEKWRALNNDQVNSFFDYFKKHWLEESKKGWYESFASVYRSTNNAFESTNTTIKDEGTLREGLALHDFIKIIVPFIKDWSSDRIPELETTKKFHLKPNVATLT